MRGTSPPLPPCSLHTLLILYGCEDDEDKEGGRSAVVGGSPVEVGAPCTTPDAGKLRLEVEGQIPGLCCPPESLMAERASSLADWADWGKSLK